MTTLKCALPVIIIFAAMVSLFAAVGISSANAQNVTGNATGGNMTNATAGGGNMTNATAGGGNMTNATAGGGNMTSSSPLPPIK